MAMTERAQPYVERLLDDRDLQNDLRELMTALRVSYGRAEKKKKKPGRLAGDRKFKQNAQKAGEALRDATKRFQGEPPKKKHRLRKLLIFVLLAGGIAYGAKTLLGGEDEFAAQPPTS
jgi:hypothetical protein